MLLLMLRFSALQRAENSSIEGKRKAPQRIAGFSALQRAENSSIVDPGDGRASGAEFQCSSASRKFLNVEISTAKLPAYRRFSALQRAENSSIALGVQRALAPTRFQCSSASRKFLNCECRTYRVRGGSAVSVLFSEPKIPQSRLSSARAAGASVSVLFSEPKIPQSV